MGNKRDHALSAIESIGYNTEPYSCLGKATIGRKVYRRGMPEDQEAQDKVPCSRFHIGQSHRAYIIIVNSSM